jgi:hypothetical protein
MAVARAAAQAAEQSERAFQTDLNNAVAETEAEIFEEATGAEPLDNDGDQSLEAMGEGLEGEVLDDMEDDTDGDAEPDEEDIDGESEDETPAIEARGDQRPDIPPAVLRAEKEKRRAFEEQNATLRQQLSTLEARFNDLNTRLGQGQQQTAPKADQRGPEKPDIFAEPEAYERWLLDRATSDALTRLREQQEVQQLQRVNVSLDEAARGERSFEFPAAYGALRQLDPQNPQHQAIARAIYNAPDPAEALFNWWDQNGGPQFREQILARLVPQRGGRQGQRMQPRHEFRQGQSLPSLNSASGSNSQRVNNPEFLDNSDASVFEFATRR